MNRAEYPTVYNFMVAWLADYDYCGFRDYEEVISEYVKVSDQVEILQICTECQSILALDLFPFEDISRWANMSFDSSSECRAWFESVLDFLKRGI